MEDAVDGVSVCVCVHVHMRVVGDLLGSTQPHLCCLEQSGPEGVTAPIFALPCGDVRVFSVLLSEVLN